MLEPSKSTDSSGMAEFGYAQTLDRSIGKFASFAAGVSYISILTGVFQLFYFGFSMAGPAYAWSWPIVFVGQLMVALCFAELAGRYPVAGSVYNWAKQLSSSTFAWLAGWLLLISSMVALGAVALALQLTLPQIWSGFQIIGDGTGTYDFALNGVLLASIMITISTLINAFGVKLMTKINSIGVFVELAAAVLLILALGWHVVRGPEVLFSTAGYGEGHDLGFFGVFLIGAMASGYVMYGFDTASSLGEETKDPKKTAPKAILRAITASFILGGLILLGGLLAAPDLNDPKLGSADGGLQYIVLSVLGGPFGKAFLACIVVAVFVCTLAVHAAAIRMMFAMARDNNLPFSRQLSKVHPERKTPTVAAIVIGVIAIIPLVVNVSQPAIFTILSSISIVLIYLSYLLVTVPLLRRRFLKKWPLSDETHGKAGFSLGKWGLPVNILAVLWGGAMTLNLIWPRPEIYNSVPPFEWYLQWGGVIFVTAVTVIGVLMYRLKLRHHTGVLAGHAAGSPEAPAAPSAPAHAAALIQPVPAAAATAAVAVPAADQEVMDGAR
ncbi:amino acid transporter [Pseudarthrobacter phenanthrenivorans Sphe3]|uniref:Amino acid transporter n=1 Tax=Pseudarthrobacter phenanthrenivorans (strain DSM 18606 / JCM 16027 / LMG 23796 / Sphe3) TaxID=930171 RepID=F0M709_PSEPM|nr:APC family permease [Pseudarthrobacter phenanthrenivorans]ADX71420.1 amino acid transporter [Pseudarthrobacter phenanthrenivorans Sphe3]